MAKAVTPEEKSELVGLSVRRAKAPLSAADSARYAELRAKAREGADGVIRSQKEAAAVYEVSLQLVKYWIGRGRKANIPTPWQEPGRMKGWWDAMQAAGEFRKDCPARLVSLAMEELTSTQAASPDEAMLPDVVWQGHDANLQQLRLIRAKWGAAVAEATTIAGMQSLLPRLEKIDTALIKAEQSYLRIATESRHLVPWQEVEVAWTDAMHALKSAERSVLTSILTDCGLADRVDEIIDALYGQIPVALPADLQPAAA